MKERKAVKSDFLPGAVFRFTDSGGIVREAYYAQCSFICEGKTFLYYQTPSKYPTSGRKNQTRKILANIEDCVLVKAAA